MLGDSTVEEMRCNNCLQRRKNGGKYGESTVALQRRQPQQAGFLLPLPSIPAPVPGGRYRAIAIEFADQSRHSRRFGDSCAA